MRPVCVARSQKIRLWIKHREFSELGGASSPLWPYSGQGAGCVTFARSVPVQVACRSQGAGLKAVTMPPLGTTR